MKNTAVNVLRKKKNPPAAPPEKQQKMKLLMKDTKKYRLCVIAVWKLKLVLYSEEISRNIQSNNISLSRP